MNIEKEQSVRVTPDEFKAILSGVKDEIHLAIELPPPSGTFPAQWRYVKSHRHPFTGQYGIFHIFNDGIGNIQEPKFPLGAIGSIIWAYDGTATPHGFEIVGYTVVRLTRVSKEDSIRINWAWNVKIKRVSA